MVHSCFWTWEVVKTQHLSKKNLAHKCTSGWREGDDTEALKRFSCNPRLRILPWELARNFEFRTIPANQFPEAYFIPRNRTIPQFCVSSFAWKIVFLKKRGRVKLHSFCQKRHPPSYANFFYNFPFSPIFLFFLFLGDRPKRTSSRRKHKGGEELLKMGLFCRGVSRPPFHKIFFFFFFRLFVSCFLLRPKTVFTVRNIFCAKKTRHFVFLVGKYFFSPFNALHIHKIRDQGIYQLATECLNQKWNCRPPQFLYVTTKGRVEPRAFRSTHRFHKLNP